MDQRIMDMMILTGFVFEVIVVVIVLVNCYATARWQKMILIEFVNAAATLAYTRVAEIDQRVTEGHNSLTPNNKNEHLRINECHLPEQIADAQLTDETTVDQKVRIGNTIQTSYNCYTDKDNLLDTDCYLPEEIVDEKLIDAHKPGSTNALFDVNHQHTLSLESDLLTGSEDINEHNTSNFLFDTFTTEQQLRSERREENYDQVDCNIAYCKGVSRDCVSGKKQVVGDENASLQFGTTEPEYNSDNLGLHDLTENEHRHEDFLDEREDREAFTSLPKTFLLDKEHDENGLESHQDSVDYAAYRETGFQNNHELDNYFEPPSYEGSRPICSSTINITSNKNYPPDSMSSCSSEDTSSMNFSFNSEGSESSLTVTFPKEQPDVFIQTGEQNEIVWNDFNGNGTRKHSEECEDTKDPQDNRDGLPQEASLYEQNHERQEREASPISVLQIGNTNSVHEYSGFGEPFCERVDDRTSYDFLDSVEKSKTKATFLQLCYIAEGNGPIKAYEKHAAKRMVDVRQIDTRTDVVFEVNSKEFYVQLGDINMLTIPTFYIDPLYRPIHAQETPPLTIGFQSLTNIFGPTSGCFHSYVCDYKNRVNQSVREENQT